jgi:hypothetical protein
MGEAKDEAARTIIDFVKAPDMFQVLLKSWRSFTLQSSCMLT